MFEMPHDTETFPLHNVIDTTIDDSIGMRAFVENGLFGWLHIGQTSPAEVAVLICGALSREALDSHHSLRVLADDFAAAGYPTMRFDYQGTGDSSDIPESAEHWAVWQQNINDAADRLRRVTGARNLILCGVRIGAALATLTAECRKDIAGLLLLAPVLRGRSYIRQLQVEGTLHHDKVVAKDGGLVFHELQLDQQTVGIINAVDLRKTTLMPGLQVAVFPDSSSRLLSECISAWEELGAVTKCYSFDGLEPLLCTDTQGYKVPAESAAMIDWMKRAVPNNRCIGHLPAPLDSAVLHLPSCAETPLHFGDDGKLFGILCQPHFRSRDSAVIIVNTGRNPRSGVGRFGVEFARRLADGGLASLRIDFAGLGDSIGYAGEQNMRSDVFEQERLPDISAAIAALEMRGYRNFAIQGICSGGYHALHAAVADTRIKALLTINLPKFLWLKGDSIADSKQRSYAFGHYAKKLRERKRWIRLLTGKSDVQGILRSQLRRWKNIVWRRSGEGNDASGMSDPGSFARKMMAELSRHHTKILFLFDPDSPGAYEIQGLFGKGGAGLKAFSGTHVKLIPGLGDALAGFGARKTAANIMIEFLGRF